MALTPSRSRTLEDVNSKERIKSKEGGLEDFWRRVEDARERVLVLDYDGTLAPFALDRMNAHPLSGVAELLNRIAAREDTRLCIVSGRILEELKVLLGGELAVEMVGGHGWQWCAADGTRHDVPLESSLKEALDQAEQRVTAAALHRPVERKYASIALHTRGLESEAAAEIHRRVEDLWGPLLSDGLELRSFNGGMELRATAMDKGKALKGLLGAAAPEHRFEVYIGDDETDEDAFRAVHRRGGCGIKVRHADDMRPTCAQATVERCEGVRTLLERWATLPTLSDHREDRSVEAKHESRTRMKRLVVVSNRLPVSLKKDSHGEWAMTRSSGGLVTALGPVLEGRGGFWIGWPGTSEEEALTELSDQSMGYRLIPVSLSEEEIALYYHGFSNEVLWPLFHDLTTRCNYDPAYWPVYHEVNRRFAESIEANTDADDYIWIHDYHLLLCAQTLRDMGVARKTGFFLHIPFPPPDIFLKLPWRFQLLEALLAHDLLGFQTTRDKRHFLQCIRALWPEARVSGGKRTVSALQIEDRHVRVGAFPIGIDFKGFAEEASSEDVEKGAWYIHEQLPERKLVLGVDRLDYTKGLPDRIRAIGYMLERHPEMMGKFTFIQVVVPSRESVPEYQQLKAEIDRQVGSVNGQFTNAGWTPIHYIYRSLGRAELLSYYRTSEVALVTPHKDGMNLVAKEYCACSLEDGVLVLSEFAGAAAQLHRHALMVNPNDMVGLADTIHRALTMDKQERLDRMRGLRRIVARQNVFWWVDQFLKAAIAQDLSDFPRQEVFVPSPPTDDEVAAQADH